MKNFKYFFAYLLPITTFIGLYFQGGWSYLTVVVAFVLVPILENTTPNSPDNLAPDIASEKAHNRLFDFLLYANIPLYVGLLIFYFTVITQATTPLTTIGMTLSMGIMVGTVGINVAHELGHRQTARERLAAKFLLMTALYMHFFIEHNRGHHKNVGTDEDAASAKKGETIYAFYIRAIKDGYLHAWDLENSRLQQEGGASFSFQNEMWRFLAAQLLYLALVAVCFGIQAMAYAVAIALVGILLLESIDYVEHYGLRRAKLASGRYEPVQAIHSWNSDHELGRILLYELTRHSDHHFKSTRKYQILRHLDGSPQLPFGYPTSIMVSLVPKLWFHIMDDRIPNAS